MVPKWMTEARRLGNPPNPRLNNARVPGKSLPLFNPFKHTSNYIVQNSGLKTFLLLTFMIFMIIGTLNGMNFTLSTNTWHGPAIQSPLGKHTDNSPHPPHYVLTPTPPFFPNQRPSNDPWSINDTHSLEPLDLDNAMLSYIKKQCYNAKICPNYYYYTPNTTKAMHRLNATILPKPNINYSPSTTTQNNTNSPPSKHKQINQTNL